MGLQRWFYAGGRPNLMARLLDRGTAALSARGVGPEYLVALEVPGRRSGRIVSLPLVVATVGGERYLVSMLGEEVNWVRNVRAAGGEVALRHGRREEVHLQEVVAPDLRAPVLKAYLKRATNASAHARSQGCAAGRVRADGAPVSRVSGRAEKQQLRGGQRDGAQGHVRTADVCT